MHHRLRVLPLTWSAIALLACGRALSPVPAATTAPAPAVARPLDADSVNDGWSGPRDPLTGGAFASATSIGISDSVAIALQDAIRDVGASLGIPDSSVAAAALADSAVEEEPRWDLDVLSYATHDQVARYVTLFSGTARDRIQSRLQRGKVYEPMIRAKFRERGIPEDLYYLALVESGFDPHAYSRAAAVGMWQFMSSTARGVGLRVDHWVDERRDPVRATDAAAKFLGMLYQQFGSYYLAAAAYNGGPGRVSRGLAKFQDELQEVAGDDRFFALAEQSYLRSETRNYVPQLIAAALIGKAPARYGMTVAEPATPFSYDSVTVPALTSLGAVARTLGLPVAEVRDLNPHLLRGVTPPRGGAIVRVPTGLAATFDSAWTAMAADDRRSFDTVSARKGQTLTSIARGRGVDPRRVAWYNPGLGLTKRLTTGHAVLVPHEHVVAASRDVPDPGIEKWGGAPASTGRVVHVVRRGESLGLIARRYRTSVTALQRANGLKRTVVYPGQQIIVRSSTARRTSSSASARRAPVKRAAAKGKAVAKGPAKKSTKKPVTRKAAATRTAGR